MRYTKNFGNKLLNMGFKHEETVNNEFIHYEDFRKGPVMVCVDHTNKVIVSYIDQLDEAEIKTVKELEIITAILNRGA